MLTKVNDIGVHLCLWALGVRWGCSLFWKPRDFPPGLASATKMHVIPRWLSASRRLKTGSIHGSCSMKKTRNCVLGWSRWKTKFYRQRILALKRWLKSYRRWVGAGCPHGCTEEGQGPLQAQRATGPHCHMVVFMFQEDCFGSFQRRRWER